VKKIILKTSDSHVQIHVGKYILKDFDVSKYVSNKDVLIITNSRVGKLYLNRTKQLFKKYNVNYLVLPDGEKYKNNETLKKIYNYIIRKQYDRSLTIVALGGGVIGDMVAFAADTFMRGVSLIHIPTTLLAQVDSSIGGKCGINHTLGKNLIGSFKHPKLVLIDTSVLKTLPKSEFLAGMAEVIKYGLIKNKKFFDFINSNYKEIFKLNDDCLMKVITTCVSTKAQIVKEDELEGSVRALLNFGHTFGHAIEASKNYKGILHGEAVSIGMNMAAAISADQELITYDEYCEIEDMILRLGLPTQIPSKISSTMLMKHLGHDKKKISGKNRFILLNRIGEAFISDQLENKYLKELSKNFIS
jgi:3-dehydroquinate synthase